MRPVVSCYRNVYVTLSVMVLKSSSNSVDQVVERLSLERLPLGSHTEAAEVNADADAIGGFPAIIRNAVNPESENSVSHIAMPARAYRSTMPISASTSAETVMALESIDGAGFTVAAQIHVVCFDGQPVERTPAANDLESGVVDIVAAETFKSEFGGGLGNAGAEIETIVGSHRLGPEGRQGKRGKRGEGRGLHVHLRPLHWWLEESIRARNILTFPELI